MEETSQNYQPLYSWLEVEPTAIPEPERYRIIRQLGMGGMGGVFLALDDKLGREVAIKILLPSLDVTEDLLKRFHREARAVAALSHPNISHIFDYSGPNLQRPYIVMERLHGQSLQTIVDAEVVPERICVAILQQVASALAHAHAAGVLHRDIKPDNIFIEPDGRVVLMDFGLAKGLLAESDRATLMQSKTRLVGTPAFSSPEQVLSENPLTAQSDVFSLGSTIYYALTQVFPFRGETVFEVLREVTRTKEMELDQLVELSPECAQLVHAMLVKDKKKRLQGAQGVLAAIDPLLVRHGIRLPSQEISRWLEEKDENAKTQLSPMPQHATRSAAKSALAKSLMAVVPEELRSSGKMGRASDETQIVTRLSREEGTQVATTPARVSAPAKATRAPLFIAIALFVGAAAVALVFLRAKPVTQPVATSPAVVVAAPQEEVPRQVKLRVTVTPWGKVSIDGQAMGTTPSFSEVSLSAGSHEVEISHPKFGTRTERVVLPASEQLVELDVDLSTTTGK